ncbi:MAG: PSD1 and planctomycete cytochrome C domain-containing protein [Verrucomicrobiota bacterium]
MRDTFMMRPALPLALACLSASLPAAESRLEFNRDVRPILSDTCFACHGPDTNKIKGGLRLDSLEAARKGGKSGDPAIVPGQPEKSAVIARITTKDPDDVMPPPESHKTLNATQVAVLRRWIAEGAEYQGHWAFIPPKRPAVPAIPAGGNEVDAFLAAGLKAKGLMPNGEADRLTLLRRAALDLTGLPPTDADREAFVNDRSPQAWSRAIDRLMASPLYGETMAMQWLDFARYADSNGFQSDTQRTMWPWRDWVIKAFNDNKPFDRFTVEQLAGDLLPGATPDQIVATGFHRNHRLNGEGGRIVEEWFAENVIDRVETTGLTWLALTMNCCRCHDHKYDPVSQKDFYSFFAYFNSVDETGVLGEFGGAGGTRRGGNTQPILRLPTAEEQRRIDEVTAMLQAAEAELKAMPASQPEVFKAWLERQRQAFAKDGLNWRQLEDEKVSAKENAEFSRLDDGTWLASGGTANKETYTVEWKQDPGLLTAVQLEVFPHDSLPNKSLGRAFNGNFVLSGFEVRIIGPDGKAKQIPLVAAESDFDQPGWSIAKLAPPVMVKGKAKKAGKESAGWAIGGNAPENRVPRKAIFTVAPTQIPAGSRVMAVMRHDTISQHSVGRFRLSTSSQNPKLLSLKSDAAAEAAKRILSKSADKVTPADQKALEKLFSESPENPRRQAVAKVEALRKAQDDALSAPISVMVMKEKEEPRDAFVLLRGEYDKIGEKVPRALPKVLPPLPSGAPNNRLGFAQWLVSGEHPLTARVWVNRAWERFFGIGIVKTSENFGSQAEWPYHPELLDWLATEFVRLKWDMKAMQKTLMMSAAYRRSAAVTPEMLEKDPDNRLLARGPRFRLPAETIRDQALAVSGLLVPKVGGPSVKPYMPEAVWDETSVYGDMRNYKADNGEGLYRRSVYTIWKRTAAPPSMLMFDSSSREVCTVKRSRSNTPTQALSLLNEVTYVEAARKLAEQSLRQTGDTDARLGWAFRRVTGREAKASELKVLRDGFDRRLSRYAAEPEAARKLLAFGASPAPQDLPAPELAAWTVTANVLLNLDEPVTRE